ncbi:MAG: glycosyltransferase, partial [Pseudomonadota bacterium]|nr:glycosyltransferase [Pseudomonadota bacterium]
MRIAVVVKGYPRLSETFVAQEILELERRGLSIQIFSLRYPGDYKKHPVHEEIKASVVYLPEYLYQELSRVFRAIFSVWKRPTFFVAVRVWLIDLFRDLTFNRIRRFGQAIVLANELPSNTGHLYAHFLHTPSSVARYASILRGISWSCSAHAVDVWTIPKWEIREKLLDCKWAVTCSKVNEKYLKTMTDSPENIYLMYHGLDLVRFQRFKIERNFRPVLQILSVGRLVEKKGYEDLLLALSLLPKALSWRFVHIGSGPQMKKIKKQAESLGLSGKVRWLGSKTQKEVLDA